MIDLDGKGRRDDDNLWNSFGGLCRDPSGVEEEEVSGSIAAHSGFARTSVLSRHRST